MTKTELLFLERLAQALEDESQVDKAYVLPTKHSKAYELGYRDGARMQAKAAAMAIRGLIGPKEENIVVAEEVGRMSTKQYNIVKTTLDRRSTGKVDTTRIKKRGIR